MNILVVKLGALGDVINTLPLVIQLKNHLSARIHWLVAPLSYPIVSNHPFVDRAILFDKANWKDSFQDVKQALRTQKFDLVLDLQRIVKSSIFCMLAKSKRRIGFDRKRCKEMTWLFPFERIPASDPTSHMLLQYLEFAAYLGIHENNISWEIATSKSRMDNVPDGYIVLNIGATKPANQWTARGFASIVDQVKERFDTACVLTGGREDREMAEEIKAFSTNTPINLVGRTRIEELISVLQHSKTVITCDTGPMHLAVALGKDVIALFGPSDPRRTGPFKGRVIQKKLHCSPCNAKKCEDPLCMKDISPGDVMMELGEIL